MTSTICGSEFTRWITSGFSDFSPKDWTPVIWSDSVTPVAVSAPENWLYRNQAALSSVNRGISQARRGEFVVGPDLDADQAFADSLLD